MEFQMGSKYKTLLISIAAGLLLIIVLAAIDSFYAERSSFFEILARPAEASEILNRAFTLAIFAAAGFIFSNMLKKRESEAGKLREIEERYRTLFSGAADSIFIIESEKFVECNKAAIEMFGCDNESDMIGKTPWEFSPKRQNDGQISREKARAYIEKAFAGKAVRFEWAHSKKDGTVFDAEVSLRLVESGGKPFIQAIVRDLTARKQTERRLADSERNLRITLNSIGDAVISTNPAGEIVRFNPSAAKLTGWSEIEARGKNINDIFIIYNAQTGEKAENPIETVLQTGKTVGLANHTELAQRDGFRIQIADSAAPIIDENGEIAGAVIVFRDVSEEYRIRARLQQSRARLKQIVDLVPHFIFAKDIDGRFLIANKAVAAAFGKTPDEIIGKTDSDLNPNIDEVEHFLAEDRYVIESGKSDYRIVETITRADGENRYLDTVKIPFTTAESDKPAVLGVSVDITERKKAEDALRENRRYLRAIIEGTSEGFWTVDKRGIISDVNKAYLEMSGYSREEIIGLGINDIDSIEDPAVTKERIEHIIEKGSEKFETKHKRKDGSVFDIEMSTVFLSIRGGVFVCFGRDITKRKTVDESRKSALQSIKSHQEAIKEIIGSGAFLQGDMKSVSMKLTETAARIFKSRRVSVWLLNDDETELYCLDAYNSQTGLRESGEKLVVGEHPAYFGALRSERVIDASDASTDPRTANFGEYLANNRIFSLLDAPIRMSGELKGAICVESVGEKRVWTPDEISFAGELADQMSIALFVNELMKTQNALKDSEERFELAIRGADLGLWDWNIKTGEVIFNENWAKLLGYKLDDIEPHISSWEKLTHQDERSHIMKALDDHFKGKTPLYESEHRLLAKDGSWKWILDRGKVLEWDENGEPLRAVGTHLDITDRRTIQEELNFQALLLNEIQDFVTATDLEGNIIYVNKAVENNLGRSKEQMLGNSVKSFGEDVSRGASQMEIIEKTIQLGQYRTEVVNYTPDGGELYLDCRSKIVKNSDGEPISMIGISTDISERKRFEKQLIAAKEKAEESDRLKTAFLANMSHEIRTPMNGVMGFASLLKDPALAPEDRREYVEVIEKSGTRLLNIINDLINISKIEAGQMELSIAKVNINHQMRDLYEFFRRETAEKGLKLLVSQTLTDREAFVETDGEKLFAIMSNLIKNAVKFTEEGEVQFGYYSREHKIEFFVKDTGIGIVEDRLDAIFDRFVQADLSLAKPYEGAGLGLAISKAYVEMLGGEIHAESTVGKGSKFTFVLPLETAQSVVAKDIHTKVDKEILEKLKTKTVLIVEDDYIATSYLTKLFDGVCADAIFAKDGYEAVDAAKSNPDVDLVLMDVKIPGIDGYEAARRIREIAPDAIIIAQTAYALQNDRDKAFEAGCDDYIAKPFKREELFALLEKHI